MTKPVVEESALFRARSCALHDSWRRTGPSWEKRGSSRSKIGTVARAVRPGASLALVDQYAPLPEDREIIVRDAQEGAIYAKRSLRGGQTFLIVKVFYDLQIIETLLEALDFTVTVQKLDDSFFFLLARSFAS